MNTEQFIEALNTLPDDTLQAILEGAGLVVFQDKSLTLGRAEDAYVIYELGEEEFENAADLKAHLLASAEAMLQEYYQFNPMSKEFFNRSVSDLIREHGEEKFISMPGKQAELKVFVDNGKVVVEGADSPRFKYGFHLTLTEKMLPQAVSNKVKNWVQSGSAYDDYISVNVCRFSAME